MSQTIVLDVQIFAKYSIQERDKIFEARKQIRSDL